MGALLLNMASRNNRDTGTKAACSEKKAISLNGGGGQGKKKQSRTSATMPGFMGALIYIGVIAYATVKGISSQEDNAIGREKTERYCWRLCLAVIYCTTTATLMSSSSMRDRVDRFMSLYLRTGTGARAVTALMVVYNSVQIFLCLRCSYQCIMAYLYYHGPGVHGWLGLEMTRWDWTLPFLTQYSDLKVLDLLDTVWIVTRGSWGHLSLLHVSHHTTMVIPYEVWLAFYDTSAPILYTLIPLMNSIVHALLYIYYTVVLGKESGWRPLRQVANVFYKNRGLLTYIQYTQFPTAIIVSVFAAVHPNGFLAGSICYGLIGVMNAVLFAPLLPFFKKRQHRRRGDTSGSNKKGLETEAQSSRTKKNSLSHNKQNQQTVWVVIEGRAVDVTEFQGVHPGGARILSKLTGRDVTHHFHAFHPKEAMVRKRLASLPTYARSEGSIAPKGSDAKASEGIKKLEADMRKRGFFEPPRPVEAWVRIFELVLLYAAVIPICVWRKNNTRDDSWAGIVLAIMMGMLWGFAGGRCGWLQHDAGHKSLFASRAANVATQAFFLTAGMSGASFEWNRRHNEHHAVTNEHHADPDINTTPLLMFYDEAKAYRPPSRQTSVPKWVLRNQAVLFTPLLCPVVALAWALYAHPLSCIRRKDYKTLLALGASHALRALAATKLTATPLHAVLFVAGIWIIGPAYLFTLFGMSHSTTPVRHDDGELHWARSIFQTTVDASPRSAFASWFCGNLNCQVAHHLWPRMPTSRLSALTDDVAELAKDLGETYHHTTVILALKDMYANLNDVGVRAADDGHVKTA